jgi:hypothetical protein
MIGMFVAAALLWVIGDLMDRHEREQRRKQLPPWARDNRRDRR